MSIDQNQEQTVGLNPEQAREAFAAAPRLRLACGLGALMAVLGACDDDAQTLDGARAGSGGSSSPGSAGTSNAGGAGAGAGGARLGRGALDAGASVERNVFRPEERPATAALVATLQAPSGFRINTFADDMGEARMLAVRGPFVYVTRPAQGDVIRLADADGDGVAEARESVASGLPLVHGIAFRDDQVYLATDTEVLRADVDADGLFGAPAPIITDLPDGGQHPRRTLGIGPDDQLYISVGSSCDACQESNPEHASMLRAALDGSSRTTFARGLRNTIGFGWHPQTSALWGMDHGSDWRGDDLPPEELNAILQGSDYGWPYCYGERRVDPVIQDPPTGSKADYCATTSAPVLQTQAHNAPIGMVFYSAGSFPAEYQGDAFVAMHGSWNRFPPTGYELARVVFENGAPIGIEDFLTGFLIENGAATFGRPAGIDVASDGSLLFSDDMNGVIYRVSYPSGADAGAPDASAADAGDAG